MDEPNTRFPKAKRLTKPAEYRSVFQAATRSVDSQFVVLMKANGLSSARLGLAISKKNVQLAVNRNKVKRLVRESFRINQRELAGLDIVVLAQKKIAISESTKMTHSLTTHWAKAAECAQ